VKDPYRLTQPQDKLLKTLPDPPEKKLCKGSEAHVANALVAKGLAQVETFQENWYARTVHGRLRAERSQT
jgi:hypothetical protein